MDTRAALLTAALKVLEDEGEAQFSTRAVCALANVTAPTLYHHYGRADGLLSAAMAEAFSQFLDSKKAAVKSAEPVTALREGWDDYVRFAAARPRLYAAMMSRVLQGAQIPAAQQAFALLIERIAAIEAQGPLALTVVAAADLMWASANAASLLYVTAQFRNTVPPSTDVLEDIRENAIVTILTPEYGRLIVMHILVTGGTGFLGGRLIPQLARDGHQVFALTRSSGSHAKLRALGASPVDADLESTAPLSLPAVDAVVHAAALFRFSGPREPFFHTNVDGTGRLLVSAENAGARIFV